LDGNALRFLVDGSSQPQADSSSYESKKSGAESPMQNFSVEPHRKQFEAIVNAIKQNQTPPVSGEESLESLAIVLTIYESAKREHPVNLTEFVRNKLG
jgi:predicted dehydrogenase